MCYDFKIRLMYNWFSLTSALLKKTGDVIYNIETLSRNHIRCGKTISILYSKCVSVALVIKHATRMVFKYCHLLPCLAGQCIST